MAPRAIWKGHLSIDELSCAVALYSAATTSERVSFHMVNKKTGNRVRREYVDEQTGKPVPREDQVKGYETAKNNYIILEPEEIASATPQGDKTLSIEDFIPCSDVDTAYFDKPYFLTPADDESEEAFVLIREGLRAKKVAAIARAVLFRRVRTVMIRPRGRGLLANTLNFDYEVLPAEKAFEDLPDLKIKGEMLDLAKHIITTKKSEFDPSTFDDRYDAALAELVKAKAEGREIKLAKKEPEGKVIDLMAALRESAKLAKPAAKAGKSAAKTTGEKKRKAS
ncbi:non-homologous end joining protein Ku [Aquamicrobium zhengzhouense]|uniref:Non-homologous end joining protein Ku n=1 Tax=Aquamicrobium zhengzhouense TaxID=2781738 RepID=A0ABS0SBN5_9HYPH|nr:Ku protein [Aquamicrobium zhengzhouense]MBI1620705.1 Ku protein [Aquamicrobium zhengzhouense]